MIKKGIILKIKSMELEAIKISKKYEKIKNSKSLTFPEPHHEYNMKAVDLIKTTDYSEDVVCAAWIYKSVEDKIFTIECNEIKQFNSAIISIVKELYDSTDVGFEGNFQQRQERVYDNMSKMSDAAKTIVVSNILCYYKTVDLTKQSNARSLKYLGDQYIKYLMGADINIFNKFKEFILPLK